jgi:BirA family biotin operon repressor/biotin-[acetyl-CoA-carboxylase] ligase
VSEKGGVYLSKLTFFDNYLAKDAFLIMAGAAVAVCKTLAFFNLRAQIKWANDIFVNGKKICGILIENTFSGKNVASSVVGIGLNVCNRLPKELSLIATSMHAESSKVCSVEEVEERLLANLTETGIENKYETYLGFMGEEVTLILGEERILATLLFVDERGNLVARTAEGEKRFSSAEVSLRIKGENSCV